MRWFVEVRFGDRKDSDGFGQLAANDIGLLPSAYIHPNSDSLKHILYCTVEDRKGDRRQ